MTQTTRRASFTVIRPLDRHLAAREAAVGAHLVEIVVQGRLGPSLVAALEGFTVEDAGPGVTRVTGLVPDQSMLFGILDMLDGLHIEVVSVNRVDASNVVSSVPNDTRAPLRP